MKNVIMRPLAFASLSFFALSCLLANSANVTRVVFFALAIATAIAALFLPQFKAKRAERRFIIFVALAVALSSLISFVAFDIRYASVLKYSESSRAITAKITDITSTTSYSGYYTAEIIEIDDTKVSFSASLLIDNPGFDPGDIITAQAEFSAFSESNAGFREEAYYLSKGIMLSAECEAAEYVKSVRLGFTDTFKNLNSALSGIFFSSLGRNEGGLAAAIFLGNRDNLSSELKHNIRTLGISHLLALSGMHMSIVAGSAGFIIKKLTRRRKLTHIGTIGFVLFYMALTGFSPSVTRAGLMMIIFSLSELADRTNDQLTSLGVACAVIIAVSPYSALDIGLQLSAISMLACFAAASITEKLKLPLRNPSSRLITYFAFSLTASIASIILTLPIICAYFGEVSLIAPLSNLLYIPLFTILLYVAPLVLIFAPAPHFLQATVAVVKPIFSFAIALISETARDAFLISLEYPLALPLTLLITASSIALFFSRKRVRLVALSALLIFVSAFVVDIAVCRSIADNEVNIFTLNRKKSDAIVVISDSHALIIDISDGSYSAVRGALNCTEENAVTVIDAYMLTHYHQKHVAQIRKITDSYAIEELWLPTPVTDADVSISESIEELAAERDIRIFTYPRGESSRIEFYDASICVCDHIKLKRSTHPVITLSVDAMGQTYLYAGASAFEDELSTSFISAKLKSAKQLYLGAHGPITKQRINVNMSPQTQLVVSPLLGAMLDPQLPITYGSSLTTAEQITRLTLKE